MRFTNDFCEVYKHTHGNGYNIEHHMLQANTNLFECVQATNSICEK